MTVADLHKWQQIRSMPVIGTLASMFPGFRDRLMGNPRFLLAIAAEELIGASAKMAAEVEARGDKFVQVNLFIGLENSNGTTSRPAALLLPSQELPFVASDMALELICNFTVVWLLSPVKSFAPAPTNSLSRAVSRLPGHFLQVSLTGHLQASTMSSAQFHIFDLICAIPCLQVGNFTWGERLGNVAYRSAQFGVAGIVASAIGHGIVVKSVSALAR